MIQVGETVRYARTSSFEALYEGYLNWHHLTRSPRETDPRMILERGINPVAPLSAVDGVRRPVIVIRSSPWKAGSEDTPGTTSSTSTTDTSGTSGTTSPRPSARSAQPLATGPCSRPGGCTPSNSPEERVLAPPLLVFAARPEFRDGRRLEKGFLDFAGVCVIERLEFVVQRDTRDGQSFPNLVVDLVVLRLDENDEVDWRWIDDRRDAALPTSADTGARSGELADVGSPWTRRLARCPPTSDEQPRSQQGRPAP